MEKVLTPAPGHQPVGRWTALAGCVAVYALAVRPLPWRLGDGLATGTEGVSTVARFNLWSLSWTAQRLPHGLSGWWDAPIFWPTRGAYAFSELQPLTALAFWPLQALFGDAVAYGLVLMAAVALNGWAAWRLACTVSGDPMAATVAGVLAMITPFTVGEAGVLQLLMLWPALLALERLLAWHRAPTWRPAAGLGLALAAGLLTCTYHSVLLMATAAVAAMVSLASRWRSDWRIRLPGAVLAAGCAAVPTTWFVLGQQRRLDGFSWARTTITAGSATWASLAPGGSHFMGWSLLAAALAGLAAGWRRVEVRFLAGVMAAATLLSLGPHLRLAGWRPYWLLVDHVGAFARLRSPFRAIAIVQLCAAVLGAVAVGEVGRRRSGRRRAAAVTAVLLVLTAVAEHRPGLGPVEPVPRSDQVWVEWLQDHPGGAVAALPMAPGRGVEDFEDTTAAMLQGLAHGHPLINGYSGFFPSGQADLRSELNGFPSRTTLAELHRRQVRYVVADAAWWTSDRDTDARALGVEIVLAGPDGVLMQLPPDGN